MLNEILHSDTLNYYLERLSPDCLSGLRKKLVKKLIRMKSFQRGRLLGQYWRVILDGMGLFYFKEKRGHHHADIPAWNPLRKEIKQSIKIHPQGYWKVSADSS